MARFTALAATLVLVLATSVAAAGESALDRGIDDHVDRTGARSGWHVRFAPYAWLTGMDGTLGVGGNQADVDTTPGDALDMIQDGKAGGISLRFEVESDGMGVLFDGTWLRMMDERARANARAEAEADLKYIELAGFYRLLDEGPDAPGGLRLDVLAGARLVSLELDLEGALFGQTGNRRKTKDWIDPIVGARLFFDATSWLRANVRFDVGGFGVGSELTWNLAAGVDFALADHASIALGYRWLSIDYEDGSGDDEFRYDTVMSGPYLGFMLEF